MRDKVIVRVQQPSVFKSKENLQELKFESFDNEAREIFVTVPPQLDPGTKQMLTSVTDRGGKAA